jgi:hypothetical protein
MPHSRAILSSDGQQQALWPCILARQPMTSFSSPDKSVRLAIVSGIKMNVLASAGITGPAADTGLSSEPWDIRADRPASARRTCTRRNTVCAGRFPDARHQRLASRVSRSCECFGRGSEGTITEIYRRASWPTRCATFRCGTSLGLHWQEANCWRQLDRRLPAMAQTTFNNPWPTWAIVQSYESFGLRKTYSAAILPSRTMMTSSPV